VEAQAEAAAITLRNGYWIAPPTGSALRLDGIDFRCAVPLAPESELEVGSLKFQIKRAHDSVALKASGSEASSGAQA
jgi:hypothetical protein